MNEMENLRRVFNVAKATSPLGQTVVYDAPLTDSNDGAQYYLSSLSNSEKMDESLPNSEKLRQVYSVCSAYTEELLYLCHTGSCMAKLLEENLSVMSCESTIGTKSAQEMAGHFVNLWNNLSISTKKLVSNFEDEVLAALRDNIVNNHNEKNFSETNKLFVACFLAVIQVHYQFSVSMLDTLVQLLSSVPGESKLPSLASTLASSPLEFALNEPLDLMASWTDLLSEMQKHLLNLRLHFSQNFGTGVKNEPFPSPSINHPSKRRWSFGGLRQSSSNDWLPNQWPAVGKRMEMDNSHIQGLWLADKESLMPLKSDESKPPFDLPNMAKRGSTDSQKSSIFASNEELQDVISLLSCQPSNPSSPTPDPANHLGSNSSQNSLWSANPPTSSAGFGVDQLESNKHNAQQFDEFGTWNNTESKQAYGDLRLQSLLEGHQASDTHQPITSTSWSPGMNFHQFQIATKSGGESNPIVFASPEMYGKESEFFMGLEFVGSDLMASVRQRRHSSGESLCQNNCSTNTSSIRTKSIDDMIADGKCQRTSTWPLKQLSPNSPFWYGCENTAALAKSVNWPTCADFPQGLPPSGFDCKNRAKMEKKYYLFGNPT